MKSRLISSIIMGLMTINVVVAADNASQRPKLVVGIVVDQLRTDYIEYLQSLFGEKGFRRLMEKGVFVSDLDFNADLRDAVDLVILVILIGAWPLQPQHTNPAVFPLWGVTLALAMSFVATYARRRSLINHSEPTARKASGSKSSRSSKNSRSPKSSRSPRNSRPS